MNILINKTKFESVEGDITKQDTEAIVNAANSRLAGGGGVDGAIHRAGGLQIMEECRKIGGCPTGEARITTGGKLKSKYVIHAVGPVYRNGNCGEPELLYSAYKNSLKLASEYKIKSLVFPSISTGAYGYPIKDAAKIAISAVVDYINSHSEIELIRFVLFSADTYKIYEDVFSILRKTS